MPSKTPLSRQLGHLFAYAQHATDKVIVWGFRTMKKAATEAPPHRSRVEKKGALRRAGTAARAALGFISNAGEAYYERYDELKRKK